MAAFTTRRTRAPRHQTPRARPSARLRPAPSAALIDAVLEHADLRDELGGGRVLLRLSPERLAEPRLRRGLGADAARLGAMAIIWDEREDCLFRVMDGAPPPLSVVDAAPEEGEDVRFELTPAALEYLARSQSRGRF
jgi:hypothetical protein